MGDTPLVLLHGWGMTPRVWNGLRICLSPRIALIPALPGHAGRACAEASLASWGDALLQDLPARFSLCGWSLGALLAVDLAYRYPQRVERLVLIGATPSFVNRPTGIDVDAWPHGITVEMMTGFIDDFSSDPEATLRRFIALQALGESQRRGTVHALNRAFSNTGESAYPALADGLRLLAETDLRTVVPHIGQPTTLIHGAHDGLMPVEAARWLQTQIPDAKLSVLPDCGHVPFVSRPEECARLIEEALHD